jgi:hypothetical protein
MFVRRVLLRLSHHFVIDVAHRAIILNGNETNHPFVLSVANHRTMLKVVIFLMCTCSPHNLICSAMQRAYSTNLCCNFAILTSKKMSCSSALGENLLTVHLRKEGWKGKRVLVCWLFDLHENTLEDCFCLNAIKHKAK